MPVWVGSRFRSFGFRVELRGRHYPIQRTRDLEKLLGRRLDGQTVPANCVRVNSGGMIYQQWGSTWYQPQGAEYVVVNPPN